MPIKDWFMGGVEAKKRIEDARKKGKAMTGSDFSPSAMKDALRALNMENRPGSAVDEEDKRRKKIWKGN